MTAPAGPGDSHILRFDDFEIDAIALELRRAGRPTGASPQAVRVLIHLAERAGRLVTREELYAAIWPEPDVDVDRGLNTLIRQLRRALDDDAVKPRCIRTYPRRGYRFLPPVPSLGAAPGSAEAAPPRREATDEPDRPGRRAAGVILDQASLDVSSSAWAARRVAVAVLGLIMVAALCVLASRRRTEAAAIPAAGGSSSALTIPEDALEGQPPGAAREAFLTGKYLLRQADVERRAQAVEWLEQAARAAPGYAPALAWLADALYQAGRLEEARSRADQALALDPDQPRALLVRGSVRLVRDWNWRLAERDLRRAVALAPRTPEYHHGLAFALATAGKHDRAIAELQTARDLDPVSSVVTGDLGLLYMYAGRFDEAATWCGRALELEPEASWAAECAFDALAQLGRYSEARRHIGPMLRAYRANENDVVGGLSDDRAVAEFRAWRARTAWARFQNGKANAWITALALAGADRNADAIIALERAAIERSLGFVTITVDPRFRKLWSHPRFAAIAADLVANDFAPVNDRPGA